MMVPKRLKSARIKAGLSQERFLQLADVDTVSDKSQISSYESGRYAPPFEFVAQIAKALDYPEAYFYTQDDTFAEAILHFYRNRVDPEFNPYLGELTVLKQRCEELTQTEARLNKALKLTKSLLSVLDDKVSKKD